MQSWPENLWGTHRTIPSLLLQNPQKVFIGDRHRDTRPENWHRKAIDAQNLLYKYVWNKLYSSVLSTSSDGPVLKLAKMQLNLKNNKQIKHRIFKQEYKLARLQVLPKCWQRDKKCTNWELNLEPYAYHLPPFDGPPPLARAYFENRTSIYIDDKSEVSINISILKNTKNSTK